MYEDNYDEALEDIRKIIAARTAESEPIRLLQAICNSGVSALDACVNTKWQKYLLRK